MSSMNHTFSRKRLRCSDYRESDSEEEYRPSKIRKKHGARVPLTVTSKFRDLIAWLTDLKVSGFFTMAVRNGSKLPHETIVLDDDDDEEEDDIQEVKKISCITKLAPFIQSLENQQRIGENDCRHSQRLLERNGSRSLSKIYDIHRTINGSYDQGFSHQGNGNYNLRQSRFSDLKRPAIFTNPDADVEILLGSNQESDDIEILSELPSTKQKPVCSGNSHQLRKRSVNTKNSVISAAIEHSLVSKTADMKPQSALYTANEIVRLQEKFQYKLLLEKFTSGSIFHPLKKSQTDAEVELDTSMRHSSHFKKEVLQQPVENFIQKYCKPIQLIKPERAKEISEKKEPCEIKIEDDDDDDIQILDIKLPEPKARRRLPLTEYLSPQWLAELKDDVSSKAEERVRIDESYQKEIERLRKERLLNRLKVEEPAAQAVEPEFPELTPEMEEAVDLVWNTGAPDDRICKITSDYLLRKDLETLSGWSWLNDLVINSYFDLIVERSKQEGYPSIHAYNTFFYSTYKTKGYSSVRRWTRKLDIFSMDLNFIPIHLGVHWCLAVIDHRSKDISYYDSMGSGEELCLDLLHEYLCLEYKDKKGQVLDPALYTKTTRKDIPQQMNGSDCGMFTLKYAEYISRDAEITFNQSHMQYFRRRMVYELLTSQLL